ncbi:MAG: phage portal protein [Rhizorhabdus sp.]
MSISTTIRDRLRRVMPWAYGNTKHNYAADFGWHETLRFEHFHYLYTRNSIAAAGVDKTIAKTWQSAPALWENPDKPADTPLETQVADHFRTIGLWRQMMTVDRRGMVGAYAGAIVLVRDGRPLDSEVGRLRSIQDIAGIIPAWEGQLTVAEWDQDVTSDTYGLPSMWQFDEAQVGDPTTTQRRSARIHPDRILIWSEDGINGRSDLEPGFNDLVDAEKIRGAGGEGFWKTSRGSPILETTKGADGKAISIQEMMRATGAATPQALTDQLNAKVDDWQSGFDKAFMAGGFTVSPLTITLPQPKEFWEPCIQGFAASLSIPFKVLIGNVTGERASTEDANEWAQTCMSRRENLVIPMLEEFVRRLVRWGALPVPMTVGWASLLEDGPDAKLDRAVKMTTANSGGEMIFMVDEIRETAGYAAAEDTEGFEEEAEAAEDAATEALEAQAEVPE